ncbi:MAG: factor-independent urate hydroxylase [Verrucomicrobiota bacterium]
MTKLTTNRYGKHKVRVMKVIRDGEHHEVCELEAAVLLEGDLEGSYLSDDNSSIVPTDTVKNTVHVLAHDHLATGRTAFAVKLGEHFLEKHGHLTAVGVELRETVWKRMPVDAKPHDHSFVAETNGNRFTKGRFERGKEAVLVAGVRDHLIMKTTGSGFVDYNECEFTTLPPTTDRILATRMTVEWTLNECPTADGAVEAKVLDAAYRIFSSTYSPSVQRTLYEIGEAVLNEVPQIAGIELRMPNVHYLDLNLSALGRPEQKSVFLPTNEPHGQIEARLVR